MRRHVVILGSSYAGVTAMRKLSNYPDIKVTLIDQHPYHFLQTEGYALIANSTAFEDTMVSLPSLCANYDNVTFKHATVKSIETQSKTVLLDDGNINYDTLVIALGSMTKRFPCDNNVYNYSLGAKSLRSAFRLNQFFQEELYKRLESDKKSKESFNIIVGGAGLSGVEIAAGMQHFFNRYYRSNALSCATLHIHLIASRETILHGMHPKVIEATTKRLHKLHVNVHLNNRIPSIHQHETVLTDGSKINFDFMIFAGGTQMNICLNNIGLSQTDKGQLKVDQYLRSVDDNNIYIVGDSAALQDKKGNPLPPTAQTAIQSGTLAARNIIATHAQKKLHKSNLSVKGIAIALGGRYAVIDLGYIRVYGYVAYVIKLLIEKMYKWPLWWLSSKGFKKVESCDIY